MKHSPADNDQLEQLLDRALGEMVGRDSPRLSAHVLGRLSSSPVVAPVAKFAIVGLLLATAIAAWLVLHSRPLDTMPGTSAARQLAEATSATSVPLVTEITESTPAPNLSSEQPAATTPPHPDPLPRLSTSLGAALSPVEGRQRDGGNQVRERAEGARSGGLRDDSLAKTTDERRVFITSLPSDTADFLPASDLGDDPSVPIAVEPLSIPRLATIETQIEIVDIAPLVIAPIQLSSLDAEFPR